MVDFRSSPKPYRGSGSQKSSGGTLVVAGHCSSQNTSVVDMSMGVTQPHQEQPRGGDKVEQVVTGTKKDAVCRYQKYKSQVRGTIESPF